MSEARKGPTGALTAAQRQAKLRRERDAAGLVEVRNLWAHPGDVDAIRQHARGLLTVEAVKARCTVDPATHCWLWQGATAADGVPRLHTLDYARVEKRSRSGRCAGRWPCGTSRTKRRRGESHKHLLEAA